MLRIGAYQFASSGNIEENMGKIREAVARAKAESVRLLVFPECALTGYPPEKVKSAAAVDFLALDGSFRELQRLSDENDLCLLVGSVTRFGDSFLNSAMLFRPGGRAGEEMYNNDPPLGTMQAISNEYGGEMSMNFDDAAQAWDTPMRQVRAKILAVLIRNSWKGRPDSVLDFGCGSGLIAFELRAHAGMVYGFDTSEEMGRVFQEKREALQADNVRFLTAEEMRSLTYDVIVSSMVMHHIPDVEAEISGLKRLLKPGRRLIWIDLDAEDGSFHADDPDFQGHNGFGRDEVKRILTDCGFRDIHVGTVFEGEKQVNGVAVPYSLFKAVAE